MLFVCYSKCSTCRKAKVYLEKLGAEYSYRDIRTENPSYDELKKWYEKSGLDIKRFFNTSGGLYKEMQLKEKLPLMSVEEKLQLLATDGMLVKRPIAVGDDFVLVGFKEKEWDAVFKK